MFCGHSAESTTYPSLPWGKLENCSLQYLHWNYSLQFDQNCNCWHICHMMKILSLLRPYKDRRSSAWFPLVKVSNRLKWSRCASGSTWWLTVSALHELDDFLHRRPLLAAPRLPLPLSGFQVHPPDLPAGQGVSGQVTIPFFCFIFSKKNIELPGWPINDLHPQSTLDSYIAFITSKDTRRQSGIRYHQVCFGRRGGPMTPEQLAKTLMSRLDGNKSAW